jgi:uncharacterized protein (TIGR02099 family)
VRFISKLLQKHADDSVADSVPLTVRWRRLRAAYRVANLATHHVLGFTIKLTILVYFLFAILILVLRYAILPNIDMYKGDIEQAASKLTGNQVSIARIYASWSGLHPSLFLGDVQLRDHQGRQVLSLPSISATLSWWSLPTASLRLQSLEIIRPDLAIRRDADGLLHVAGMVIDPAKEGDSAGAEWLLSQREIVIRQGRLNWTDQLRGQPGQPEQSQQSQQAELALEDVNLVLRNKWQRHRFALVATPPAALGQALDVRGNFVHPRFTPRISDLTLWKGELYADIKSADLAALNSSMKSSLNTHDSSSLQLQQGTGSVRAWFNLDHARLAGFTADVALTDVALRAAPDLPLLDLQHLNARISADEVLVAGADDGTPTFGLHGHALALSNLTLKTRDGLTLAPTSLSERHVAAAAGKPASTAVAVKTIDLQALAQLAAYAPLTAPQRQLLFDLALRGSLQDFSLAWQGALPTVQSYSVKGKVVGLGWQAQAARSASAATPDALALPALPGVDNLTGAIDASERGGTLKVNSSNLSLQMPAFFSEPAMPFDQLDVQARWSFEANEHVRLQLDKMSFLQQGLSGTLSGSHLIAIGGMGSTGNTADADAAGAGAGASKPAVSAESGAGPGFADFSGTLNNFDLKTINRYLPLQTPPDLRAWLSGALEDGLAQDVTLRLRGDLSQFPFDGASKSDKNRGQFRVAGRIQNGKLNYAPGEFAKDGKAPLWPQAQNIKGSFLFERARMEIKGDTARTGGVALSNVKAVIADLNAKDLLLDIDGTASGQLQEHLNYVAASPVLEWIGNFTEDIKASGNTKLALKLHLPLSHLLESKVIGSLQLQNNDVVLFEDMPALVGASGKIEFNEKGVTLNRLGGTFLGGPMAISGGSLPDDSIQVRLAGSVVGDALGKAYPSSPVMQRLATRFNGSARYNGLITANGHRVQVAIDSNLVGLGLDFPAPANKAASDSIALKFSLSSDGANAGGLMRDEIRIALGSSVAARYQRTKQGKEPWQVVRGGIGANVPAPQPDGGMMISADMKLLDVDAWIGAVNAIAGPANGGNGSNGSNGANEVQGSISNGAASDGATIAQYIVPDTIAARAGSLIVGARKLDNVVLGGSNLNGTWQANIDSTQVAGHISVSQTANGSGLGKVTARLASLIIPESAAADVRDLLEGKDNAKSIPALDIVAERFELFGKQLGRLNLQANNAMASTGREWRISKLSLANPDGVLTGSGKWVRKDGKNNSSLNFVLDIVDAGKLLDRFGFIDTVRHGKGKLSGDIAWMGLPYSFDIASLSGLLNLDVDTGQFLKQDPGAAKLLGVLSLQALPRLLKLDFRDVFSEGLAFDGITATAVITNGVLKTDNLKMHGVAATVLMSGSADLARETSNLDIVVIPEFNLGTGPLVYALAVNPVIGIGGFLAQLFLRAPMMKALTYQMKITGPWKSPSVAKVEGGKFDPEAFKINELK